MRRNAPGWLLAGTLLLAGCGGEPADSSSAETSASQTDAGAPAAATPGASSADACAVLPAANVGAVLGQTLTDSLALAMPPGGPIAMSQCNYATADDPALVSFLLHRGSPGQAAEAASGGVRQTFDESGIPLEDVTGLADVAFFGSNQLHVFSDAGWYFVVTPVPSAGLEQARALAQAVIQRLESGA